MSGSWRPGHACRLLPQAAQLAEKEGFYPLAQPGESSFSISCVKVLVAYREAGVTDRSHYRWRRVYAGLKVDQARRLKQLEKENDRLKPRRHEAQVSGVDPPFADPQWVSCFSV